jgi:hypothetical protein
MDRYVVVRASALADLCELVDRALDALDDDVLKRCLWGAAAEVRAGAVFEPVA